MRFQVLGEEGHPVQLGCNRFFESRQTAEDYARKSCVENKKPYFVSQVITGFYLGAERVDLSVDVDVIAKKR